MTIALQPFRANDTVEARIRDCALPIMQELGDDRDTFYAEANDAAPLGDVIYALNRDPLANGVLSQAVYRKAFWAIHELFTRAGTFEFYLNVFRAIWGDDANIQFTVPSPGVLQIDISEIDLEDFQLAFREIVADVYVDSEAVTDAGENLIVRDSVGTKNQSEVDALIAEISPEGVFVTATLTL